MRLEEHILRIAREAVMNALRHAEATRIAVTLDCADSAMRLGIADDGRGFDPDGLRRLNGDHWGLVDMHERARLSGGCVTVQSRPGEGTRVEAVFPMTRASA
jgi:signal transduction histidine kinase